MAKNSVDFSIKVDNIKELIAEKNSLVERAMVECGFDMERFAKENCPVDTGRLRNSITFATAKHHSKGNDNQGAKATAEDMALHSTPEDATVYVGTNVEYAPYVEYGSGNRTAYHYLKKSVQEHLNDYKDIINNVLKD